MGRGYGWTDEEIAVLRAHYETGQRCDIELLLPNRQWKAIRTKAEKLGLLRLLTKPFLLRRRDGI